MTNKDEITTYPFASIDQHGIAGMVGVGVAVAGALWAFGDVVLSSSA